MKRITFLLLIMSGIAALCAAQMTVSEPFRQEGIASWYGGEFDGKPTASGEIFNSAFFTAAHPTLPFGTMLTITNTQNNRRVTVRVNDRGPFVAARIIDLSRAAAEVLDMLVTGTAPVIVERAAENSALGPAGTAAPQVVQVSPQPAAGTSPAVTSPSAAAPAPTTAQQIPEPAPTVSVPVQPQAAATAQQQAPAPVQPRAVTPVQPAISYPPAAIKGGIPPAESAKYYRLQIGAYGVPRNAIEAFDRLKAAGLNPAYERFGDLYRVVLAGLKANEIPAIAQILGNAGFAEALIREEN